MKKDKIVLYIKKNLVASASELQKISKNRMLLVRLEERGEIQRLGIGFYSLPSLDIFTGLLIVVAKYYKDAAISGLAAAKVYGLSDENIDCVDVDIPNNKNIRNSILNVRRISKKYLIGIDKIKISGENVKIYNPERILSDIYRYYSEAICYKAIKRYLKKYKPKYDEIAKYDKILKTNVLRIIKQELADE
ncbi:MAG: type IV toxin-antitoxin system AbiEi family antitoxin [Pseudomonadota bacterium]